MRVCVCVYIVYMFMHDIQANVLLHICYVAMRYGVLQQCVVSQCVAMCYGLLQQYTAHCSGACTLHNFTIAVCGFVCESSVLQ